MLAQGAGRFTVKLAICNGLEHPHTANLTGILALTLQVGLL